MKLEEILKELCKYMNDNNEEMKSEEWSKLYEAKELIKEAMKEENK